MKRTLINLFTLAATLAASAQTQVFDNVVETILSNDPDIKVAQASAVARKTELASEANLNDPEIEFEYLFGPSSPANRWNIGVSQSFDWPGVYAARRYAAEATANADEYLARTTAFEHRAQISSRLIDYINTVKSIEALEDVKKNTETMKASIERGVKGGEMTRLDLNKLAIELAKLDTRLAGLENDKADIVAELTLLNGNKDLGQLLSLLTEYPARELKPIDHYVANLGNDPTLSAANARLDADIKARQVSLKERYPGFSVGYVHAYEENTHFNGFSFGLTLPFFSSKGKVAAANARIEADRVESHAIETQRISKISADYKRVEALSKEIAALGNIFETTDNIALLLKAFKGGEINVITYISETNYFTEARLDYLDILYRYNSALNALQQYE